MLKLRGKVYHSKIKIRGKGVWKTTKTGDINEAKKFEVERIKNRDQEKANPLSWEKFEAEYLAFCKSHHVPTTYEHDQRIMKLFKRIFKPKKVTDFNLKMLDKFKEVRQEQGLGPGSINRELNFIKAMMNRAMQWECIPYFDTRQAKRMKETERITLYYELEDIARLRQAAKTEKELFLIDFGLYTGFRVKELCGARWEDVDFEHNTIQIKSRPGYTIKDRAERVIKLHPNLRTALERWREFCGHVYILQGRKQAAIAERFRIIVRRAKLKGSIHTLRHTVGTHLTRKEGIASAKEFLGHSSTKITERYSHQKSVQVPIENLPY